MHRIQFKMMRSVILLFSIYGATSVPVEDNGLQEFITGNHKFTSSVYKEMLNKENGNFIFSPFSVEVILALTNEGARGVTSEELVTGLSLPSTKEKIQKVFKSILPNVKRSDEDLKLLSANKIYIADDLKLEENFRSIATSVYDSELENVDFRNREEAVRTVNKWVEDNTANKIQNLLDKTNVSTYTRILLVNALYFNGKWESEFKTNYTSRETFYKSARDTQEVDTMYQFSTFKYYENPKLNAKFLEVPYKGGSNISMVIVLPNQIEGLARLEQNIDQVFANQPYSHVPVGVHLPKFKVDSKIEFKSILQNLGVRRLFTNASLSGLLTTDRFLEVGNVIQKAFIDVSETGTEAAAATTVEVTIPVSGILEEEENYEFKADHPFLYFIKSNDVILFAGRITKPS